jgi:hypothetical protein
MNRGLCGERPYVYSTYLGRFPRLFRHLFILLADQTADTGQRLAEEGFHFFTRVGELAKVRLPPPWHEQGLCVS